MNSDIPPDEDYQAFLSILALAKARHPVTMFGFSLMPNHFYFVIEASHHQSPTAGLRVGPAQTID
jgi:hypothetical protein